MLDAQSRIQPAFDPKKPGFKLDLPTTFQDVAPAVVDLLTEYQIERHIRRDTQEGPNRLKKEVLLDSNFKELWNRIKPRTTYRVEFKTDKLVERALDEIKRMSSIEAPKIRTVAGQLRVAKGGVVATALGVSEEPVPYGARPVPDLLAYLQNETELTRSTLVHILKASGRLAEFFANPQRFMDEIAHILKTVLHRMLVDGIKYERIPGTSPNSEWEMMLFKNEELINYLSAEKMNHSLYEYVVYDSEIERSFAKTLDDREDIRLFVKLPGWFEIDTPVGKYNPDWAIVKHHD
jgi:type III restriction enzyme